MVEAVIFLVASVFGITFWGLNQTGRISVLEQKHADLRELLDSKFSEVCRRLGRIEDALNGFLHKE